MVIVLVNARQLGIHPEELTALYDALKIPEEDITFIETEPDSPERHLEDCRSIGAQIPVMVLLPTSFNPGLPTIAWPRFRHIQICGTGVNELYETEPKLRYKPFVL